MRMMMLDFDELDAALRGDRLAKLARQIIGVTVDRAERRAVIVQPEIELEGAAILVEGRGILEVA